MHGSYYFDILVENRLVFLCMTQSNADARELSKRFLREIKNRCRRAGHQGEPAAGPHLQLLAQVPGQVRKGWGPGQRKHEPGF